MTENTLPFLTPRVRRIVYAVFAVLGIAIGAAQVAFAAAALVAPVWLAVTLAVYAFVGGQIGFTAADRVPKPEAPEPDTHDGIGDPTAPVDEVDEAEPADEDEDEPVDEVNGI